MKYKKGELLAYSGKGKFLALIKIVDYKQAKTGCPDERLVKDREWCECIYSTEKEYWDKNRVYRIPTKKQIKNREDDLPEHFKMRKATKEEIKKYTELAIEEDI